jgi:Soluble lytic murein transglycosylase and related regulatory proteins (some contain LysM/invasin domains)
VPKAAEGVDEGAEGLNEGAVPPEFVKWLKLGGNVCPEITPALLAGQQEQESQFNVNAGSPAGAQGPAQFMPGTWATWGRKVDDNGEPIGPPGSGDIHSPADATMAQARLMCEHASVAKRKVESGAWHGDLVELALAAYNAGEGNVDSYGGVPPFAETQHYVKVIPSNAQKYRI